MSISEEDNQFEKTENNCSYTFPIQTGLIKKGGYCMLKGHPCRVIDFCTSKAGKHGCAKACIIGRGRHNSGLDIFTNKKYEESRTTTASIQVPIVKKSDYPILDISNDGIATLFLPNGGLKQDLNIPEDDEDIENAIEKALKRDSEMVATVI